MGWDWLGNHLPNVFIKKKCVCLCLIQLGGAGYGIISISCVPFTHLHSILVSEFSEPGPLPICLINFLGHFISQLPSSVFTSHSVSM